jgi:L,D-transpeptidase catalytic domain/Putative peptidoglycan binding domain
MRVGAAASARTAARLVVALPGLALLVLLPATASRAQAAASVALDATPVQITVGQDVSLTVQIDPPAADETVSIVDANGRIVATGTTGAAGRFDVAISPTSSTTVHAEWGALTSAETTIGVRADVRVRLGSIRLDGATVVRGHVRPAVAGARADVTLVLGGQAVSTHHPLVGAAGGFRTRFRVPLPGSYRVRARFADADHLAGTDEDGPRSTPLPTLRPGSHGVSVRLLERRLVALHYRLVGIDGGFDARTADAVMAFRKVQRMPRTTTVDAAVWRALADPLVPRPRAATDGFHIEVDQSRQVLYTVKDGAVTNIIHVSTGKPSTPTRDGSFFVTRKIAGYSEHQLYYPSYFDGARAIHGWPDVPSYAASHGCVRVPYWHAKWVFGLAPVGTRVVVYH